MTSLQKRGAFIVIFTAVVALAIVVGVMAWAFHREPLDLIVAGPFILGYVLGLLASLFRLWKGKSRARWTLVFLYGLLGAAFAIVAISHLVLYPHGNLEATEAVMLVFAVYFAVAAVCLAILPSVRAFTKWRASGA